MKKILFTLSLLSVLCVPHFSYAAPSTDAHHAAQHHITHHRSHSKAGNTQPVNINTADASDLTTLKGIGVKRAEAIISYRQAHGKFASVNDLAKVKGIGPKGLLRLQKNNANRITLASR